MKTKYRTLYTAINTYTDVIAGKHARAVRGRAIICTMSAPNSRPILSTIAGRYVINNCAVCILSVAVGVVHESPIYLRPLSYPYHVSGRACAHPAVYVFVEHVIPALQDVLPPK